MNKRWDCVHITFKNTYIKKRRSDIVKYICILYDMNSQAVRMQLANQFNGEKKTLLEAFFSSIVVICLINRKGTSENLATNRELGDSISNLSENKCEIHGKFDFPLKYPSLITSRASIFQFSLAISPKMNRLEHNFLTHPDKKKKELKLLNKHKTFNELDLLLASFLCVRTFSDWYQSSDLPSHRLIHFNPALPAHIRPITRSKLNQCRRREERKTKTE